MSDDQQSDSFAPGERPGKLRTMWHPLLVRVLDFTLGSAFSVQEEISVGKMPLRVDILLIRRKGGTAHGNPGGRNLGSVAASQPIHSP
jgi:hypothetical protein